MKATLYEALGINPAASDEEVRASLRRLIRKYYTRTRDGQGNVEEALRFINHASRILSDPHRRSRYDQELAVSAGTTEQKIAHVVNHAVAEAGEQTDVAGTSPAEDAAGAPDLEASLDAAMDHALVDEPAQETALHHPGLTERVVSFSRSPWVTLGLCVLFGAFIAAAILFVTPADAVLVAKQVLVWLTLVLIVLAVVYGVVHAVAWVKRRAAPPPPALQPQTDLAILNWRREKSVFLGTNQPQEDASWIFQLRMAELERAKSGRTSEPRPWHRLAARLFDYAIWGLVLALLLSEVTAMEAIPDDLGAGARPSADRAGPDHADLDPGRGAAHRRAGEHAGQVAVRHLPAVLDLGRLRPARHAGAAAARAAARLPRLVGGRGLRVPAARALPRRRGLREAAAAPGDRLGLRRGRAGDARAAGRAQCGDGRVRPGGDAVAVRRRVAPADGRFDRLGARHHLRRLPVDGRDQGRAGRRRRPDRQPADPVDALARCRARRPPRSVRRPGRRSTPCSTASSPSARRASARCAARDRGCWPPATSVAPPSCAARGPTSSSAARTRGAATAQALQAQGYHQEAINAFRKAKLYDPGDRTIDAAIDRSQKGIVADFLARYRR